MNEKRTGYDEAYRKAHRAERAACQRLYRNSHKAETTAYWTRYQRDHKAEIALRHREYQNRHRLELAAYGKKYREMHRADLAEYRKGWDASHKDRIGDARMRRRARNQGVTTEKVGRMAVYERDRGRCHICRKKVPRSRWHLEHIVALARGGAHTYSNVAVACPKCNMSKGTKGGAQLRLL